MDVTGARQLREGSGGAVAAITGVTLAGVCNVHSDEGTFRVFKSR